MALYKFVAYLAVSQDAAFDTVHTPGSATPFSGIYKCMGCGKEIVSEEGRPFPPQNHHQHSPTQGQIRWKMILFAQHDSTTL